ncbi:NAD(P)-dependent oxidoreductase [Kutzneria sp. CA-103260]|uniref:NAD(P)-dependent oxidoreductase n=1 Tax=Kutzneria sp. CA-103260 TaxID=2802641 RepID=UPI001BA768AF|nr:NAD(P)H-binding protein [Kutzneria sp. CA-103260]QUQ65660.1 NAD-dependent epimerase/dehydratase [Kutzneria sp. CA-103260]
MATVVVFGATGYSGEAIAAELARRGHQVTGVSRTAEPDVTKDGVRLVRGSVEDAAEVADLAKGADVVVVAVHASAGAKEMREYLPGLLEATSGARIGFMGGAGSLHVAEGGPLLVEGPDFPDQFKGEALAHKAVLDALRQTDESVDWFYVSPAAGYGSYAPGETTGTFRIGGDVLLTDAEGNSRLSAGDLAKAFADEIERPAHRRARLHVAY